MTHTELAESLGIQPQVVDSAVSRCKEKLTHPNRQFRSEKNLTSADFCLLAQYLPRHLARKKGVVMEYLLAFEALANAVERHIPTSKLIH